MDVATRPGTIIEERYKLERLLGEGAHGSVWLAQDIHLKRQVAIKMVLAALDESGQTVARLQREAKVLQRLDHPNIVQVYRIGMVDQDTFYLAIEYVQGRDLSQLLSSGPMTVGDALLVAEQITDAMYEAEKRGVIHRDLKPQNILLVDSETGSEQLVKVADFGLCTMTAEATMQFGSLTRAGSALGTPLYMSPEQCQGGAVDIASDIYAFGCVLFEMVTGQPPYQAESSAGILMKHVRDPVPNLLSLTSKTAVTQRLAQIISKCMAKNPRERYQSFADVHTDLKAIDQAQSTTRLFIRQARSKKPAFRPNRMALLVVACLALNGLFGATVLLSSDEQKGAVLAKLSGTLSPHDPQAFVLNGIKLTERVLGQSAARNLAATTLLTDEFRGWPMERKMDLLTAYVALFSESTRKTEADMFANALLGECLQAIAEHLQGKTPLDSQRGAVVAKQLEFLLRTPWHANTWKLFAQTISDYSGAYQLHAVATMPDTRYAMLLEEFLGESMIRSNPRLSRDTAKRAAEMYFNASARAAKLGYFDNSRAYVAKVAELGQASWVDAKLILVSCETYAGQLPAARRDFEDCVRMRESEHAPFILTTSETTFQRLKKLLYASH